MEADKHRYEPMKRPSGSVHFDRELSDQAWTGTSGTSEEPGDDVVQQPTQVTLPPRMSGGGASPSPRLSRMTHGGVRPPSGLGFGYERRWYHVRWHLQNSDWYHSVPAARIRFILQGKKAGLVMICALGIALFLPDLWIIFGINSNLESDLVLSIVMLLFCVELIALSAVDAAYLFSFFWLMDIVGTVSMIFDISYLFGEDNTTPNISDDSTGRQSLFLLRAARAARVGARAGRLSRILRVFRFLPGTGEEQPQPKSEHESKGIASVISSQLANLLATKVALLTILIVMVMPVFEILSYPSNDFSLQTWVERVSASFNDGKDQKAHKDLDLMVDFYKSHQYGPYMACRGYTKVEDDAFVCEETIETWHNIQEGPPREASSLLVHTKTFMVGFNMHAPIKVHSLLSILNTLFIIFIMIFSGVALSTVVTELAVHPLERMLTTVRTIASTVFRFGADGDMLEDDEELEDTGIDSANEMVLLEQVVDRLATIAELHTKSQETDIEGMEDEDIGILSMMKGENIASARQRRRSEGPASTIRRKNLLTTKIKFESLGVTADQYQSLAFNTLPLTSSQRCLVAVFTIARFHESGEGFIRNKDEEETLQRFVQAADKEYLPNFYHNFAHAVDVVHGVARMMRLTDSGLYLSELEQFSLLIAAVGHDLGHPGLTNGFLTEVSHELALKYNDKSPLENMHCSLLYQLTTNPMQNVFGKLSKEQYKEVRKNCIAVILHTDMMLHLQIVQDLQLCCKVNEEVFGLAHSEAGLSSEAYKEAKVAVFRQPETKELIMHTLLHSADISGPCRTWEVSKAWAMACLEEFFAQGDKEKERGIPVQFLNDRDKLNKANSQIGFIEFMVTPLVVAQHRIWPALHIYSDELSNNIGCWRDIWVDESKPSEEERQKVNARVGRVRDKLANAHVG